MSEQSNVVKLTTAVYSEKYQLCKAVTGLATFSTLIVVYIILFGRAGTSKYLQSDPRIFIYVLRKFKQHGLFCECRPTEHSSDN